jgi:hypothetical protein
MTTYGATICGDAGIPHINSNFLTCLETSLQLPHITSYYFDLLCEWYYLTPYWFSAFFLAGVSLVLSGGNNS